MAMISTDKMKSVRTALILILFQQIHLMGCHGGGQRHVRQPVRVGWYVNSAPTFQNPQNTKRPATSAAIVVIGQNETLMARPPAKSVW
jgi:hypothetical protein